MSTIDIYTDSKVERHKRICNELNALFARKNHDYGDSFHKTFLEEGIAMPRIRLSDKLERFKRLSNPSATQQVSDESIRDTLLDLANYAIMTVLEMEEGLPSKKEANNEPQNISPLQCTNRSVIALNDFDFFNRLVFSDPDQPDWSRYITQEFSMYGTYAFYPFFNHPQTLVEKQLNHYLYWTGISWFQLYKKPYTFSWKDDVMQYIPRKLYDDWNSEIEINKRMEIAIKIARWELKDEDNVVKFK